MQSPTAPLPRRRNGRPQACEPCRRRKVACDHALPICSRCRRGNIPSKCIYLVDGRPLVSSPGSAPHPHHGHKDSARSTPATQETSVVGPSADQQVGYLGATSFSAVFEETQSNLRGVGVSGQHSHTPTGPETHNACEAAWAASPALMDVAKNEAALRILRNIPTKSSSFYLFKMHTNPNDGWVKLAAYRIMESMWDTFGKQLEGTRNDKDLSEMAHKLSQNSTCALAEDVVVDVPGSRGDEWLAGLTGTNLRWEALGVLFTYWSFGTISLSENDATIDCTRCFRSDRKRLWRGYKESAFRCIELTREMGAGSALCAYLLYKHVLLETYISGDAGESFLIPVSPDTQIPEPLLSVMPKGCHHGGSWASAPPWPRTSAYTLFPILIVGHTRWRRRYAGESLHPSSTSISSSPRSPAVHHLSGVGTSPRSSRWTSVTIRSSMSRRRIGLTHWTRMVGIRRARSTRLPYRGRGWSC